MEILKVGDILINTFPYHKSNHILIIEIIKPNIIYWDVWKQRKVDLSSEMIADLESHGDYKFYEDELWIKKTNNYSKIIKNVWVDNMYDFLDPNERDRRVPLINYNIRNHKFKYD